MCNTGYRGRHHSCLGANHQHNNREELGCSNDGAELGSNFHLDSCAVQKVWNDKNLPVACNDSDKEASAVEICLTWAR